MSTVATVEARMTSTRLPGKVLMPILGRPMLALLIERLQRSRTLDAIVIATTSNPQDDPVSGLAEQLGVGCYRGSEHDVLDRVVRAAQAAEAEVIVEITGDCPLIDPEVIDRLVEVYRSAGVDYVANVLERTYPAGLDTQVFARELLERVAWETQDPDDREHVSLYIYRHPEFFSLLNVESGLASRYSDIRLTVDTAEDFSLVREIYEELYPVAPDFGTADVLALLDRRPDLAARGRSRPAAPSAAAPPP